MLAADPLTVVSPVSPLSYLLGIAALALAVAALALAVAALRYAGRLLLVARRVLTFHRAGMARVQAADTAAAARRARTARRTVVDVDDAGRVTAVRRTTRAR